MKTSILLVLITFALVFALVQKTQAVSPPPPGGYPNFTTAAGDHALQVLASGLGNTAIGTYSLFSVTTGNFNTAVGAGALDLNTADSNTASGTAALLFNTIGTQNTANGTAALEFNQTGNNNTANGAFALFSNTSGADNTATGSSALYNNTTGVSNTALGESALYSNITGGQNTALGQGAGFNVTTASNVICIGAFGANVSNSCYVANIAGQTVGAGGSTCYVDNDGKLDVFLSARRFKTDIADMENASAGLLALRPVTFHYKPELDKIGIPQFGLIAEEVAKVNPDLVTHDAKGELSTVRYEAVNAMLLNEFLKEHRIVKKQQREIDALKSEMKEQKAQIQKVSAQLESSKPAPQVVNNP
jgi:hypothetical protein